MGRIEKSLVDVLVENKFANGKGLNSLAVFVVECSSGGKGNQGRWLVGRKKQMMGLITVGGLIRNGVQPKRAGVQINSKTGSKRRERRFFKTDFKPSGEFSIEEA